MQASSDAPIGNEGPELNAVLINSIQMSHNKPNEILREQGHPPMGCP